MASEQPKPGESTFPATFSGYPPPPPQGAYPYLPFAGGGQEGSDGAAPAQPGYMMFHPTLYYSNAQTQPYTPPATAQAAALRPKRKQVKMACTNCANACKRCDESRPCERCIKYNTPETCVDGQRKERKKGIKRGPYKRKNKLPAAPQDVLTDPSAPDAEWLPGPAPPNPVPHPPPPPGYVSPDGHPPLGFYPMYFPPPTFMHAPPPPAASSDDAPQNNSAPAPPPHGLPYFLPPYAHPFPYPGLFHPPPPAQAPPQVVADGKTNTTSAVTPAPESTPVQVHPPVVAAAPAAVAPVAVAAPVEKRKKKNAEGKATKKAKRVKEPEPTSVSGPASAPPPEAEAPKQTNDTESAEGQSAE